MSARLEGTIALGFSPENIRYASVNGEQAVVLDKSVAFADESTSIGFEYMNEGNWRILVDGKVPAIHLLLVDCKGDIELLTIDTATLTKAVPLSEKPPKAHISGEGKIEIDPEDIIGTVFFGDTAFLLEEDTAVGAKEFLQDSPFVRINDFLLQEWRDGRWRVSFAYEMEADTAPKVPVRVTNSKGNEKKYLLQLPACTLTPENGTRTVPEMRHTSASSGYFSFDMKKGFIEIGNTVIKLDSAAGTMNILKDGEMESRDFLLENIRGEMTRENSWTLTYDFSSGKGEENVIPVKFIDEAGGMFADIMAGKENVPILVPKDAPDRQHIYGNFNMFNGDDEVFFSVQGQNGTPVGDGARFRLPEGSLSLYHMGKGWYVCEFVPNDEWKSKDISRSVAIHGMESGGDEAEHTFNIEISGDKK